MNWKHDNRCSRPQTGIEGIPDTQVFNRTATWKSREKKPRHLFTCSVPTAQGGKLPSTFSKMIRLSPLLHDTQTKSGNTDFFTGDINELRLLSTKKQKLHRGLGFTIFHPLCCCGKESLKEKRDPWLMAFLASKPAGRWRDLFHYCFVP